MKSQLRQYIHRTWSDTIKNITTRIAIEFLNPNPLLCQIGKVVYDNDTINLAASSVSSENGVGGIMRCADSYEIMLLLLFMLAAITVLCSLAPFKPQSCSHSLNTSSHKLLAKRMTLDIGTCNPKLTSPF